VIGFDRNRRSPCSGIRDRHGPEPAVEGIPADFVIWGDEFDGYPTADRCSLWDAAALKLKLSFVEALRDDIVAASRAVLELWDGGNRKLTGSACTPPGWITLVCY